MSKTVSLAIGIGGARGISHLGVMKYLEENNYQIKSVLDSSIGSPVALFDQLKKAPRFKEINSLRTNDAIFFSGNVNLLFLELIARPLFSRIVSQEIIDI